MVRDDMDCCLIGDESTPVPRSGNEADKDTTKDEDEEHTLEQTQKVVMALNPFGRSLGISLVGGRSPPCINETGHWREVLWVAYVVLRGEWVNE